MKLPRSSEHGSALISTLLAIVVLTIVVTAFLQSMSVERQTARSYLNVERARLAAIAGAVVATDNLATSNLDFPVNAYEEVSTNFESASVTAPYLVSLRLNADSTAVAEKRFLNSSYSAVDPQASPADVTGELVDINSPTYGYPTGWIGLRDVGGNRRVIPVPWVEVLADASLPKNTTKSDPSYNPVVARFAYWVDDESAKLNVAEAGNISGPAKAPSRSVGGAVSEISLHKLVSNSSTANETASEFFDNRELFPEQPLPLTPKSYRQFQKTSGLASDATWDENRAFVTTYSVADERGATGFRRINLNDYVDLADDVTTSEGRQKIADNVLALGDFINTALPNFAKRFSTDAMIDPDDAELYTIRLAANIYDYIDQDSQPTVIRHNKGGWEEPPDPTGVGEGAPPLPPIAFGKEIVPQVTEYLGYFYNEGGALRIDHTFEILNLHEKPLEIDSLGTVQILLAERNDVTPRTGSNATATAPDPDLPGEPGNPPLALSVPAGTTIPAGRYALLTTLPTESEYRSRWVTGSPIWVDLARSESSYAYGGYGLRMDGDQLATSADVLTEILVINEFGYLDIQARVAQQGPANFLSNSERLIGSQPFGNEGTSGGNNSHRKMPLDTGDPRSATDIFPSYSESGGSVSAIAWRRNTSNSQSATKLNADSNGGSYGFIPDNSGPTENEWVPEPLLPQSAPSLIRPVAVIRNEKMESIGELGFVYDPAIPGSLKHSSGTYQRSGFRTLAIGSTASELASGAGNLPQTVPSNPFASKLTPTRAYRLLDIFKAKDTSKGSILVNSVLRDPANRPLKALFETLKSQSNATPANPFANAKDPNIPPASEISASNIITSLENAVAGAVTGPFLSLGQISDLEVFNSGTTVFAAAGTSMSPDDDRTDLLDSGREEILRNTLELLTLKGSVYSIHVLGQSGESMASGDFRPTATSHLTRVIRVERLYPGGPFDERDDLAASNTPSTVDVIRLFDQWN